MIDLDERDSDGRTLATGSIDHCADPWSLTILQSRATLDVACDLVSCLAVSPNGIILALC